MAARAESGLPDTLREVLLARVSALSEDAQRILGMAAVAGRSVDAGLLGEVAARPEPELEEPLREALAAQLLVSDTDDGRYRFRHALLAEAVYDDLLPSERRRLHAAYASALDARPVPDGAEGASLLAALAHHATAAHEPVRALRAWIAAARAAADAYAFAESVRSFEHAIGLWDAVPPDDRPDGVDAATLHYEASLGAMVVGRLDLAVDLARVSVGLVDPVREPERWATANERLARAAWVSGATQEGTEILEATAAAMERAGPSPERARVLASLASAYMLRGGHARAIPIARGRDRPRPFDRRRAGRGARHEHARNEPDAASGGAPTGPRSLVKPSPAILRMATSIPSVGRMPTTARSCSSAGRSRRASRSLKPGLPGPDPPGRTSSTADSSAGTSPTPRSSWAAGMPRSATIDDLLAADVSGVTRVGTLAVAGTFLVRRGRAADARPLLAEGRVLVESMRDAQFTGPIHLGLVELALTDEDAVTAAAIAEEALDRLAHTGDRFYALELAAAAARAEADAASLARALRDDAGAAGASERARSAAAMLERMQGELAGADAFGGRLDSMTAIALAESRRAEGSAEPDAWRAAIEAADRAGSAWTMAYVRFRLAESMLESRASRRDAEAALAEAHAAADRLGAAPLRDWIEGLARRARVRMPEPAAVGVVATADDGDGADPKPSAATVALDRLGLTRRELEVLPLVAAGHTNKRIAELLFISENTAGVHVSNILGKLGVATRTEAAAIAARLGL